MSDVHPLADSFALLITTIITSQLPMDSWYNFIDEPTLADAIMDKLSASAHRIALTGKSLGKTNNH
jgi:DNA replication protein DnaC